MASAALLTLVRRLLAQDVVTAFALTASDDVPLAAVFCANGFRKTGVLAGQLVQDGRRCDAIVWARRLASPTDD